MKKWLVRTLLIGSTVGAITAVGVGSWVAATRPYYHVTNVVIQGGDDTLNGIANTSGSETNNFILAISGQSGYGGTLDTTAFTWSLIYVDPDQAKDTNWIFIFNRNQNIDPGDNTITHVEWTDKAKVGTYEFWVCVSLYSREWRDTSTTTLTIS
jgi:hypothetical protein